MSQASANIAAAAALRKSSPETVGDTGLVIPPADLDTDTAMAAALRSARPAAQTKAKPAVKAQAPAKQPPARRTTEGGNAVMPFTLERAANTCPSPDRMSKIERMFGLAVPDAAELSEVTEDAIGTIGKQLVAALGEKGEVGTDMALRAYVEAFVVRACLACEMADTRASNVRREVSKFNAERSEDRDGPSGFPSYIDRMMERAAEIALQAYVAYFMAEGAVSAYAHVTGEDWKPRDRRTGTPPLDQQAAQARLSAFE